MRLLPWLTMPVVGLLISCSHSASLGGPGGGAPGAATGIAQGAGGAQASAPAGTGDSAGGNGPAGGLFEKHIVDIRTLPEWKAIVEPLRLRMKSWKSMGEYISPFYFGPTAKTWYMVDGLAASVSKETLGVDFIKDPIFQYALQFNREIWLDNKLYLNLGAQPDPLVEKARVLVHESAMQLYLLRFESLETICEETNPEPIKCPEMVSQSETEFGVVHNMAPEAQRPVFASRFPSVLKTASHKATISFLDTTIPATPGRRSFCQMARGSQKERSFTARRLPSRAATFPKSSPSNCSLMFWQKSKERKSPARISGK